MKTVSKRSQEIQVYSDNVKRQLEVHTKDRLRRMAQIVDKAGDGWTLELEQNFQFVVEATRARADLLAARKLYDKRTKPRGVAKDIGQETAKAVERGAPARQENVLRFQASVRFLRQCSDYLISDPHGRERLVLVTGSVTPDGLRVLDQMVHVSFDQQSAGFVSGNAAETHRKLIELDRDGHELLAMFHSHIMRGAAGTRPSAIDIDHQNRVVSYGSDAIGGIFSLDGYVRLFGTGKPIEVSVYGTGANVVERGERETVIKLEV